MIKFKTGVCPRCGHKGILMYSNNPLSGPTICFDCVAQNLNYKNLEHGEFFCRTYNLPWNPDLWVKLAQEYDVGVFRQYTELTLNDAENQPNLAYSSTTHDLWAKTNKEWEKCRSFEEILTKLVPIKESYITRGRLKWGEQYTFEELIQLDSLYTRTIKANNIINPLQKEAVKALCKIHIEMDEAIRAKDAKALKDFASAYATFAKQADLEGMINETKTDDITTVAELYDYMEKNGFQFEFYDNNSRDEVDRTIKDMQEYLRKLVLESTGLGTLLEEMARTRIQNAEQDLANQAAEKMSLDDLMNFSADDMEVDTEADDEAINEDFSADQDDSSFDIIMKEEDVDDIESSNE